MYTLVAADAESMLLGAFYTKSAFFWLSSQLHASRWTERKKGRDSLSRSELARRGMPHAKEAKRRP